MEREAKIGIDNTQESTPKSKEDKFNNTIVFLRTAIAEGAHLKRPDKTPEEAWVRQKNIVGIYFGSPAALEDLGRMYGVTRERIRQLVKKSMEHLWLSCLPETQALFPFGELELRKPLTQKSRERISEAHGGKSVLINRELQAGKSIREIQKEKGISRQQIKGSRHVLREWSTAVPFFRTPHSQNLELEKNLKNAEKDQEKQEVLSQVKRRFYQDHVKGENSLLIASTNIALEAGLSLGFQRQNRRIFIESLKNVGFPMGEITEKRMSRTGKEMIATYHFILARDKERAKRIVLSDPNLQRFRRF